MYSLIKKIIDKGNHKTQILRYLVVAVIATVLDFIVFYILVNKFNLYYLIGAGFGFLMGLIINHILCISFVFDKRKFNLEKEIRFLISIGGMGILFTLGLMFIFTDIFGIYYVISRVVTIVIVFFWNFLIRKYVLFS